MSKITLNDIQNPLYLHPSDGPSTISVEKLQGAADYRAWKRSMEIALASKRKLGFVTGTIARDAEDKEKQEQWDTCNCMIIAWILFNVSDSIKKSIVYVDSARAIWKQLEQRYSVVNGSRKYRLNKEIYELKQKESSINEYYTTMKILWEELESMSGYPVITNMTVEMNAFIRALEVEKEEQRLFQFLNGLNETYASQRSNILMRSPLPTVEEACAILQQEEAQRVVLQPVKVEMESSALYSKGTNERTVENCSVCGKRGHGADKCWSVVGFPRWHPKHKPGQRGKIKDLGQASRWKGNPKGGYGQRTAANVQCQGEAGNGTGITIQQLEQMLKQLPGSTMSSSIGRESDDEDDKDYGYAGMAYCNSAAVMCDEWIVDSGASDHMTCDLRKLTDIKLATGYPDIRLPNGKTSRISHVGTARMSNELVLKNVLCVPDFKHNLISVNKLVRDSGCKVNFMKSMCVIEDDNKTVKGVGKECDGLYYLIDMPMQQLIKLVEKQKSNIKANLSTIQSEGTRMSEAMKWHIRLGHTSFKRVKETGMVTREQLNNEICVTCPLAKFTKQPYKKSKSHASEPFELIHMDIWGPYRVLTRKNHRYFLTVVDDNTRCTWVHLLKLKSDACAAIEKFVRYAKNQFGKRVKIVRSDNALEFIEGACKKYFEQEGIVQQTTCVDRPRQNGRAERRHRNILEMARALNFQAGLPTKYWGDCVMTAAHLTNRIPTPVLNNKTPFEALNHRKPAYEQLKVFGCLVFAYNPSNDKDKFGARGVPCVHLGYAAGQKGYKLLNLFTGQVFVSRDTKFYEDIYPYKLPIHNFRELTSRNVNLEEPNTVRQNDEEWIEDCNEEEVTVQREEDTVSATSSEDADDESSLQSREHTGKRQEEKKHSGEVKECTEHPAG
ncbi:Retrovirus-related Pol polyprotein from transposon RE1 [Bienertia sinuspersici]